MAQLNRIKKVQKLLEDSQLEALIVDCPLDLFYLTNLKLSLGRLVIDRKTATLFVDGRYIEACTKNAPCKTVLTQGYGEKSAFGLSIKKKNYKKMTFDSAFTSYAHFLELKKHRPLLPLVSPIKELRQIKEDGEIASLKKAAKLGKKGFQYCKSILKEGITEIEVAASLEIFWMEHGGEGVSFSPIIAFGKNASQPHYKPGNAKLKKGDSVLIDIGVMCENYASDMTRVVFFGPPNREIKKIYSIVEGAQKAALSVCKPGISAGDIDAAARKFIEKAGFGDYFNHSLGHGVGLEVHEFPVIRNAAPYKEQKVDVGMVFTIEPGIYLPSCGGVRLEDTIVITEDGCAIL